MVPYFHQLSIIEKKIFCCCAIWEILHYILCKFSFISLKNLYHAGTETFNCAIWDEFSKPYQHQKTKRNHIQSPISNNAYFGWVALNIWNNIVKPILLIGEKTHSNSNLEFGCTDTICVLN